MASISIITPPTPIIHEEEMPNYEDDDLQTIMEPKEDEGWRNIVGRGLFGLSPLVQAKDWWKYQQE